MVKDKIVDGFDWFVEDVSVDDCFVFYFFGYGFYIVSDDDDEDDDELICFYMMVWLDFEFFICDDDLGVFVNCV